MNIFLLEEKEKQKYLMVLCHLLLDLFQGSGAIYSQDYAACLKSVFLIKTNNPQIPFHGALPRLQIVQHEHVMTTKCRPWLGSRWPVNLNLLFGFAWLC